MIMKEIQGLFVQDQGQLGNSGRLHSHMHTHFHALPPLTHVLFPLLFDELQ